MTRKSQTQKAGEEMYLGTVRLMTAGAYGILNDTEQARTGSVPGAFESNLVKEGVAK